MTRLNAFFTARGSRWLLVAMLSVPMILCTGCARAKATQSLVISAVQRADCTPATQVPVYRFIATTADGSLLPPSGSLASKTQLTVDGQTVSPFYVSPFGSDSRPRLALILLDVSGSMMGQPFATARSAASRFVQDFNPALDRIAIAPFGSRDVATQIRPVTFTRSREEAERAIAAVPLPRPDSNTALFSAADIGLDTLAEAAAKTGGDPEMMLILLTDGKNDLSTFDRTRDPSLLTGPEGLQRVAMKLRGSRAQTFTIGFGPRDRVNESDLKVLGRGDTHIVQSREQLESVFISARRISTNSVAMAFALPETSHPAGRDMDFRATVNLPNGVLEGGGIWRAPQFSPGVAESICSVPERKAALSLTAPSDNGIIKTIVVFLVIGAVLLIAWFLIPKLIWSDYDGQYYQAAGPSGGPFDDEAGGRPRGMDDPTQIVPKSERSRYK